VPPIVGGVEGHDHVVADPHGDLLEAPGAQIFLARLERVHERDLEVLLVLGQPNSAQSNSTTTTARAAATIT
jgi:hypothetical protein